MLDKVHPFEGCAKLSERIFLLESAQVQDSQEEAGKQIGNSNSRLEPDTIILFTWGNGSPKHVSKYVDEYRKLYTSSRIIIVLCGLLESMIASIDKHTEEMIPVVKAAFPPRGPEAPPPRILVQIMSNSGAVSFLATVFAYKKLRLSLGQWAPTTFPHTLLVCDSTPGGLHFWSSIPRWSQALALSTGAVVPLPTFLMRWMFAVFAVIVNIISLLSGWHKIQIGRALAAGIRNSNLMSMEAKRLYLYSKRDELVPWEHIEEHVAVARGMGYDCTMERFDKSPHVGHMRMYGDRYWGAIESSWRAAVGK
jgi:hypothetical protein